MRGYDRRQVDELLARIEGTIGRTPAAGVPVTAADVRAARFTKKMRGYAPAEVDEALRDALAELERQAPLRAAGASTPGGLRDLPDQDCPRAMACQPTSTAAHHAKYPLI